MAERSCDLRSAVGDGAGDAEDDDAASLLPPDDLILKRGDREAENASLPAVNSARNSNRRHIILGREKREK